MERREKFPVAQFLGNTTPGSVMTTVKNTTGSSVRQKHRSPWWSRLEGEEAFPSNGGEHAVWKVKATGC